MQYSAVFLLGGGSCYFHIQGRKIEAVLVSCREIYFYPETGRRRFLLHIRNFYQTIRGQITENGNSHSHHQEKLRPHKQMKFLCLVFITSFHYCSFLLLVNQLNHNLCFASIYFYIFHPRKLLFVLFNLYYFILSYLF